MANIRALAHSDKDIAEVLAWIITEIGAGKTFNQSVEGKAWNNAHDRCLAIIYGYANGEGLFQLTRRGGTK